MRLALISCDVFFREMCAAALRSPHTVDTRFLPKGLHDGGGARMRPVIQSVIDEFDTATYDGILLGYGLCNNGLAGLSTRTAPLVVVRAHDCMTLFLGSRDRYRQYFFDHPGTYFLTSGWIERGKEGDQPPAEGGRPRGAFGMTWDQLVEQYGEENAAYLVEQEAGETAHYKRLAFIEMGVEPDDRFERQAREKAGSKGWDFEKLKGKMSLIDRLLSGDWDHEDILRVPPGSEIVPSYDEKVIDHRPLGPTGSATASGDR